MTLRGFPAACIGHPLSELKQDTYLKHCAYIDQPRVRRRRHVKVLLRNRCLGTRCVDPAEMNTSCNFRSSMFLTQR